MFVYVILISDFLVRNKGARVQKYSSGKNLTTWQPLLTHTKSLHILKFYIKLVNVLTLQTLYFALFSLGFSVWEGVRKQQIDRIFEPLLDFILSPCSECCMLSSE